MIAAPRRYVKRITHFWAKASGMALDARPRI
jgi:hypothetical protein